MIQLGKKEKKPKVLIGVQQNLIYCDDDTKSIITFLCEQSNSLYNCGVYWARQLFFKTGKIISKFDPIYEVGQNIHAQAMPSVSAQQTLLSVSESFKSFKGLRELFFVGELDQKPKAPNYRESGGLFKVTYPNVGAGKPTLTNDGNIRFPLGLTINRWFKVKEFFLPLPTNLDFKKVKEFTILPKNGEFYLECSYETPKLTVELDVNQALSIDLGTSSNLMACVDTLGNSFLVDSRQAKSMNQLYNKRVANYKEGKPQHFWDGFLDRITRKRNHQMRDMVNKGARLAIDHCLESDTPQVQTRKGGPTSLIEFIVKESQSKQFAGVVKLLTIPRAKPRYTKIGFIDTLWLRRNATNTSCF